jgi:hypothetical protein
VCEGHSPYFKINSCPNGHSYKPENQATSAASITLPGEATSFAAIPAEL